MGESSAPVAFLPSNTTFNYPTDNVLLALPLTIDNVPVLTVSIIPLNSPTTGVLLPKEGTGAPLTLANAAEASTVSNVVVSVEVWPNSIIHWGYAPTIPSSAVLNSSAPVIRPTASSVSPTETNGTTTTTSGIPSSTTSKTADRSTSNLSNGAIAGTAIGSLLAGAAIASLIAWFCLGRKGKRRTLQDTETSALALKSREKGPMAKTRSLNSGSPVAIGTSSGLPQPVEDKAISGEISKISNLIKNHVQSYYHTKAVSPGMIDYEGLHALGSALPLSVGTLSTLLQNPVTRELALRFCIAWVTISRLRLESSPAITLLPIEISHCLQAMSLVDRASQLHAEFFAHWRAITAELTQATYVRNAFSTSDSRLHNVEAAAIVLDNVLRPYADTRIDNGERSRNLEQIVKRAASFGFTLFSQSTGWDFDWQTEHGVKSGSLCLFPALVQVSDENGEANKPPRLFSEAVVRRLDD